MGGDVAGLIQVGPASGAEGLIAFRGTRVTHRYPPHWHDELHLCAYIAGSGYVGDRTGRRRVVPGDFLLTPPGELHHNWVDEPEGVTFRSLYVPMTALRDAVRQVTGRDGETVAFAKSRPCDPRLMRAFLHMHRGLERSTTRLGRDGLLAEFLGLLILGGEGGPDPRRSPGAATKAVQRARDYLHGHSTEPVALADLSRVAALSPFHLHRAFRRVTGLPPHGYLVRLRVNQARDLLRRGLAPAEVAHLTGFCDQSHLTRHFHRLVGVTPARFRAVSH